MAPLEAYRAKRSPSRTPEPFGNASERPSLFVVQQHAARRMHYDFRLELNGVLKSWAVPKGPSFDPAEKRLAVETEDHPAEYADFEGIIPAGNYGAGPVIVWDRGAWEAIEDPIAGLEKGKLLFRLRGYKLRGVWQLVRTKANAKDWLLIKKPDAFAGPAADVALTPESILSGLRVEQLKAGESPTSQIRADLERLGVPTVPLRIEDAKVMLAETAEKPFTDPEWIFELKYDGFRALAARHDGQGQLRYRSGNDATANYPELTRALGALPCQKILLDGEIVVLDEQGVPSFQRLQQRAMLQRARDIARATVDLPATLYCFDLLSVDDYDLRGLPLLTRKTFLKQILPKVGALRYADHVETQGEALFAQVRERGLEGIVAKKSTSRYASDRSGAWLKIRAELTGDFVVVGFTRPKDGREGFGALHLAARSGGELVYVGRVGTGFSLANLVELRTELEPHRRDAPACSGAPKQGEENTWVEPALVLEVRYHRRTWEGQLRGPSFLRRRPDKRLEDITVFAERPSQEPARTPPELAVERKVPFTNLDKVFWPDEGYTKGDLIEFYRTVSPWLLPYLKDRPLVMTRFPDGIDGKSFYQKDAPAFVPGWVRLESIYAEQVERDIAYFVCDDLETLLYVANLGTIPLHIWSSRAATLQQPDWCVLDLDPKEAPFSSVITVARAIHALCDDIGLPAYPKTSGQSGIHVLIPLGGQCTYEQSRTLGNLLARVIEAELPDISTTQRVISARGKKVYLDFLQNRHGQTIAAPFSLRPRPRAPVSMPLQWSEVDQRLTPSDFNIRSVIGRLKAMKRDPMREVLEERPNLNAALQNLAARLHPPKKH